ncbi:MAG: hypothetical protein Kow0080_28720 [Candidatus Promineifilaceae bacterium]
MGAASSFKIEITDYLVIKQFGTRCYQTVLFITNRRISVSREKVDYHVYKNGFTHPACPTTV